MIKLSVIVPTYNVKDYIEECITSLLNQTLQEIEILIINDGSTDGSIDKLKTYKSDKIKVIHRENGGLSAARNTGMKFATGEYIAFVDSDDFILMNEAYEQMYEIAKKQNSDIVVGNAIKYYSQKKMKLFNPEYDHQIISPVTGEKYLEYVLDRPIVFVPVWLSIFRREFIVENNFIFKEGIYHEDEQFSPRVLLSAQKVSIYNQYFYAYRQREGSIMNSSLNSKKALDVLDTCKELQKLYGALENKKLKIKLLNYLGIMAAKQIHLYKLIDVDFKERKQIFRNIHNIRYKIKTILLLVSSKIFILIPY